MEIYLQKDFPIEVVLSQPLMASLSTVTEKGEPRDSPVWFTWEMSSLWMFGMENDSFIKRLRKKPQCAVSVVEFDVHQGILKHVGIRGVSAMYPVDVSRLHRFLAKYLGEDKSHWNPWFIKNIADPLNVMVQITAQSIVAKNVSFFKTGPNLTNGD